MHLAVVGLNHKTASVNIREKVAFTPEDVERALSSLSAQDCICESLILSTCNRTEIYTVFTEGCFDPDVLREFVAEFNEVNSEELNPHLYQLANQEAVEHLFRVISGLDSMVIGENQIASQAKQAYRYATIVKATGPILNKLFHIGFRVGKKVRTQTGIGTGSLSVSQVACDLAEKIFKHLSERSVLLVGAGENGELTAKTLKQRGVTDLLITNRTYEKAVTLAEKMYAEPIRFSELGNALAKVDIVISSTGASEAVLTHDIVEAAVAKRHLPLFMIDVAIPRDIDPTVDDLDNVFLYDMDALANIVSKSKDRRSEEAHKAKRIIADEVARFMQWHMGQKATPTILELQDTVETIRRGEMEKLRGRLDEKTFQLFEEATRAMMSKVLHPQITSLRKVAQKGDQGGILRTIRKALGLGEES